MQSLYLTRKADPEARENGPERWSGKVRKVPKDIKKALTFCFKRVILPDVVCGVSVNPAYSTHFLLI